MSAAPFSFQERLGIYFGVQSACLSIAAILALFLYSLFRLWKQRKALQSSPSDAKSDATGSSLFWNLMFSDLLQAIGCLPSIRWMMDGAITEGPLCTAQGVVQQLGINGVAVSSLGIAIHTFTVLILRRRVPRYAPRIMVLLIWLFIGFVVGTPHAFPRPMAGKYYGDTGYWCWIVQELTGARILSQYLWVWLSALAMSILYGIMFLVMRRVLVVGKGGRLRLAKKQRRVRPLIVTNGYGEEKASRDLANLLLFYPAVYLICITPFSISRWLSFTGTHVPYQLTLFSNALLSFSGFFNVILYFTTRRDFALGSTQPLVSAQLPSIGTPSRQHLLLPSPDSQQGPSPASSLATPSSGAMENNNYEEVGLLSGRPWQSHQKHDSNPKHGHSHGYERLATWNITINTGHSRDSTIVHPSPTDTTATGTTLYAASPVVD